MRKATAVRAITLLLGFALLGISQPSAWAIGEGGCTYNSCTPNVACSAGTCGTTVAGTDNCGNPCQVSCPSCPPPPPSCVPDPATCVPGPKPSCGKWKGTGNCGTCTYAHLGACPDPWRPYGFAVPDDPLYGFGLPSNDTKELLALAAKGNIVIGDYTSEEFKDAIEPLLQPKSPQNPQGKTQEYAIDPSDQDIGYFSYAKGGRKMFNGDYTKWDGGYKLDPEGIPGTSKRKFYESSLPDDQFQALVETCADSSSCNGEIQAVLFTNHALTGLPPWTTRADVFGSIVSRDDALVFKARELQIAHDVRLLGDQDDVGQVALPFSIKRPEHVRWEACPPDACPALP